MAIPSPQYPSPSRGERMINVLTVVAKIKAAKGKRDALAAFRRRRESEGLTENPAVVEVYHWFTE